MSDALNPNQVEALQQAITAGGMSTADGNIFSLDRDPAASVPILQYDFKRPERISKDQIRSLKTLHESFARNVGSQWTGLMRAIVEVDIVQVEQMTYAEYTAGLSNPTCFGLVRPDTLDGTVCLELSPQIFFAIVDRLMGGGGATTYNPERPLTLIETRLPGRVLLRPCNRFPTPGRRSVRSGSRSKRSSPIRHHASRAAQGRHRLRVQRAFIRIFRHDDTLRALHGHRTAGG